jgi:hypothetical protein
MENGSVRPRNHTPALSGLVQIGLQKILQQLRALALLLMH